MKPHKTSIAATTLFIAAVLGASTAGAQPPNGFSHPQGSYNDHDHNRDGDRYGYNFDPDILRGLSVNQGKDRLRSAGFESSRNIKQSGQQWDLWRRYGRDDQCVGFTSYKGKITDANRFSPRDCDGYGRDPEFQVRSLEGIGVKDAKVRLRSAGFEAARNIMRGRQQWDLWRSTGRDGQCVGFTSYNGTVTATDLFRNHECG